MANGPRGRQADPSPPIELWTPPWWLRKPGFLLERPKAAPAKSPPPSSAACHAVTERMRPSRCRAVISMAPPGSKVVDFLSPSA